MLSSLKPWRLAMHPKDSTCFVTVHSTALRLWDVARLRAQCSAHGPSAKVFSDPEDAHCCDVAHLPKVTAHMGADPENRILDISFTVDGTCIAAITKDCLFVWQLATLGRQGLRLIQQLTIDTATSQVRDIWPDGPASIRFLAERQRSAEVEAMVLAGADGCNLAVYAFTRGSTQPVGQLLQHICFGNPGSGMRAVLEVDTIMHTTLALTFGKRSCSAVLPLATHFSSSSRLGQRYGLAQKLGIPLHPEDSNLSLAPFLQQDVC
ncbi:unnamed protein product [Symbiodinium sp. KB8]|nr:unnamed protein product [Symbiodinium sp. KB8]